MANRNPLGKLLYENDPIKRRQKRLGSFLGGNEATDEEPSDEEKQDNSVEKKEETDKKEVSEEKTSKKPSSIKSALFGNKKSDGLSILFGPYIRKLKMTLIVVGIMLMILLIILILFADEGDAKAGHYSTSCNYNGTTVTVRDCADTPSSQNYSLKDYVISSTYRYYNSGGYSNEALKAIMIVLKTNVLSNGNYSNSSKSVIYNDCYNDFSKLESSDAAYSKLENIYNSIEDEIYVDKSYEGTIESLTSSDALTFNDDIAASINKAFGGYESRLKSIYVNTNSSSTATVNNKNLFIGDSRTAGMKNIMSEEAVYGIGYGYSWFIGDGTFSNDYTNALSGAIEKANEYLGKNETYNVYLWLGINDFTYVSADKYIAKYKELAEADWKKHTLYVVEIGPIDENGSSAQSINGFTNEAINTYNNQLKELVASSNLGNLRYLDINYNITSYDEMGVHYGNTDYTNIYNEILSNSGAAAITKGDYGIYSLENNCEFIVDQAYAFGGYGSNCGTSSSEANLLTFVDSFEGTTGYCSDGSYRAIDGGDRTITVGHGVTNHLLSFSSVRQYINDQGWGKYFNNSYTMYAGDCIPVNIVENVKVYAMESVFASPIDTATEKYGITLTQYQRDACTSFNYNVGPGNTDDYIKAYAEGGEQALWDYWKQIIHGWYNGEFITYPGLMKRRKAEFALFITGDYTDQGKFNSRSYSASQEFSPEYTNIDSEGIFARRATCIPRTYALDGFSANPDDAKYSNLKFLIGTSFQDYLAGKGITVEGFNDYLASIAQKAGVGTRQAVVNSALGLIDYLAADGYKLNYQWGGKYLHSRVNPNWGKTGYTDCYGSYAQAGYNTTNCTTNYKWISLDCTGFVEWAVVTGFQFNDSEIYANHADYYSGIKGYSKKIPLSTTNAVCLPGDVLDNPGHDMLVVGVDEASKAYIVAEATGATVSTNSGGVKLTRKTYQSLINNGYQCMNLDYLYKR